MKVFSPFVTGAPASSFPNLKKREKKRRRNQVDTYLLGIQTHGIFKFRAARILGHHLPQTTHFTEKETQAHSG